MSNTSKTVKVMPWYSKLLHHSLQIVIAAVVVSACVFGCVAVHKSYSTKQAIAQTQAAQAVAKVNAVTDSPITITVVWADGKETSESFHEEITPTDSKYTGAIHDEYNKISTFSLNPLESSLKAGEKVTPSTYHEGDRPAIKLDDNGVNATASKGQEAVGESGWQPTVTETLLQWVWIGALIVGCGIVLYYLLRYAWNTFKAISPTAAAAISGVVTTAENDVKAVVSKVTAPTPVVPTPVNPANPASIQKFPS